MDDTSNEKYFYDFIVPYYSKEDRLLVGGLLCLGVQNLLIGAYLVAVFLFALSFALFKGFREGAVLHCAIPHGRFPRHMNGTDGAEPHAPLARIAAIRGDKGISVL